MLTHTCLQADPSIAPQGTLHYYNQVADRFPEIDQFYRYFQVPGLEHCWGGKSGQPTSFFDQLRSWVENGTAPDSSPITVSKFGNSTQDRIICPYPKKAVYTCSDIGKTGGKDCWSCVSQDNRVELVA